MEAHNTLSDDNTQPEKHTGGRKSNRKRSITIVIVVSLLNVGLLALLWSLLITPAQRPNSATSDLPTGNNPLVGHAAPNFMLGALSTHSSQAISLADFKGKPIVLNFWSSSCGPCQDEAPFLRTQWQQVQSKGIAFIGVDYQDGKIPGLGFLQKYAITYPNVMDADGSTAINYGVTGIPETFFIDRHGVIVSWQPGPLTTQTFQSYLQKLVR